MNFFARSWVVVSLAVMLSSCTSHERTKSEWLSSVETANAAGIGQTCVMQFDGQDVLRLTAPTDAECIPKDGFFRVYTRDEVVDIWMVPEANTLSDAVERIAQKMTGEFNKFKVDSTTDLTIAHVPAKELNGPGDELDGDDGRADVLAFRTAGHVFLACTHGEHLSPADREWMLNLIQTVQAP